MKETEIKVLKDITIEINDAKEISFTAKKYTVFHNYKADKVLGSAIIHLKDDKMIATITLNTTDYTKRLNIKNLNPAIGYKVDKFEGKGKDYKIISGQLLNLGLCDGENEDPNIKNIGEQLKW